MRFEIKIPCPGHRYGYEIAFCHPDWDRYRVVSFMSLEWEVGVCGWCADNKWKDTLYDWFEANVCQLELENKSRPFGCGYDKYHAYTSGTSHKHYWSLCANEKCGNAARSDWFYGASGKHFAELSKIDQGTPVCSIGCAAVVSERQCVTCKQYVFKNEKMRDKQTAWWKNKYTLRSDSWELMQIAFESCSEKCFGVASNNYVRFEMEKKCVKAVSQLLKESKKALRSQDLEALSSLKKAFELEATLLE